MVDWQETPHYITALAFTPDSGETLVVGFVNGDISVYDLREEKLRLVKQVNTRKATIS